MIYCLVCRIFAAATSSAELKGLQTPDSNNWPIPSVKIVGGVVANITAAPYQVSIRNVNGQHFCGGTIISSRSVLTAAHCVIGTSRRLYVVAGVDKVNVGFLNPVTIAVVHKDFNNETMENDLAILRVGRDLDIDNVTRKALPIATKLPPDGTLCTTSGWGSTYFDPGNAEASIDLRITDVPIYNLERCRFQLGYVPEGQICAGYEDGGHDSCQGDSGGPLECRGKLTGIVSWGLNCGKPRQPGAYTSVPFYKDWILLHTNSSPHSLADKNYILFILLISSIVQCLIFE
uniref:Trypsin 3A1 n=1 Tax=Lygus hesperus TaxID=30085 RepID=A0A0A9ZFZ3_LYGHE